MGIVVSVAMLLALTIMLFRKVRENKEYRNAINVSLVFVALVGFWNSAWYGLQNMPVFWGMAGLLSGVLLIASAGLSFFELKEPWRKMPYWYCPIRLFIIMSLALYFLLYVVTIVQINLGMAFIR